MLSRYEVGLLLLVLVALATVISCESSPSSTSSQELATRTSPTEQAVTLSPSVTSTVMLEPTPTPTVPFGPSAILTETPSETPADYRIEEVTVDFIGANQGLVVVEFSVTVVNTGDQAGPETPIEISIDGEDFEAFETLEGLAAGERASFFVVRQLTLDEHLAVFSFGDSEWPMDLIVRAAEVVLEVLGHRIVDDGFIEFEVKVTNRGDLPAEAVALSAEWRPRSGSDEVIGKAERAALLDRLEVGESRVAVLPIAIANGSYTFNLTASTSSIEAVQDNNAALAMVDIDYVDLSISLDSVHHSGYTQDGRGIMQVRLLVSNRGVAESGPLEVGIECEVESTGDCSKSIAVDSIAAGGSAIAMIDLAVPQGETDATAYAGDTDDGYRWGDNNSREFSIDVLRKQAVSLALQASAALAGYWSDGTANVEISVTLRNEGYRRYSDEQQIAATCSPDRKGGGDCGKALIISLADGYGPTEGMLTLRLPMGKTSLNIGYGVNESITLSVEVPERILGVDRDIWECFSDRPGEYEYVASGDRTGGCGGWALETIRKWDINKPVRVWADPSGDPRYVQIFGEVLDELSSLLHLDFQSVEKTEEADLKAYVGVPTSHEIGDERDDCRSTGGCAWKDSISDNVIEKASFIAWIVDEPRNEWDELRNARGTIMHEVLHVLADMVHRRQLSSIMRNVGLEGIGPYMNRIDRDLITLYGNPLIEPGMTISEVERTVVFADELLDPSIDPYAIARGVRERLKATSAGFNLRASASGYCNQRGSHHLDWGVYQVDRSRGIIYFHNEDVDATLTPGEDWHIRTRDLERNPVIEMLSLWAHPRQIVGIEFKAYRDDIHIERLASGDVLLIATMVERYPGTVTEVIAIISEENFEVRSYSMVWKDSLMDCIIEVEATEGEYGIEINVSN